MMTQRESCESKITLPPAPHRQKTFLSGAMNSLARLRIILASVAHEWTQGFPDIVADHQVGEVVLLGRLVIDDHQPGAAVFGQHGKARGRPYQQRGTDGEKQVAM